ncbi:hypothetical protein DRQ53_13580 [bacterium]|nr:MAG: hypothetical protein DRQ53_13580 [bacterium]
MICAHHCLWIVFCLATTSAPQLRPIPPGARSYVSEDSLSYEEFRQLPAVNQRELREQAHEWLSVSRDALKVYLGREPHVPWRFRRRPRTDHEFESVLRRSFDAAATSVGYCPYNAEAWIQYGNVALLMERDDVALACVGHARNAIAYEHSEAIRDANRLELERMATIASFNMREYVAAKEAANAVLAITPWAWDIRLVAARAALQLGQYGEARRRSTSVPEFSPEYALARSVVGAAELGLGNHDAALKAFEEAEKLGLVTPEFENDWGRLSLAARKPVEAVEHFSEALRQKPEFSEAACNLATAHRRNGNLIEAEAVLVTQLFRVTGNGPVHFALAEVYREFAAEVEGDERQEFALRALEQYDLALEHGASADLVIERRGTLVYYLDGIESVEDYILDRAADQKVSAHVLAVLARVKKGQGRLDIAENILRMAISRDDANALVFAEFGEVLLRRGKLSQAREALGTACSMDQALVVSRINLSVVCELLGDMPAAWAALDEAIELDALHPLVRERTETAGRL